MSNIPVDIQKMIDQPIVDVFYEHVFKRLKGNEASASRLKKVGSILEQAQAEATRLFAERQAMETSAKNQETEMTVLKPRRRLRWPTKK